MGGGVTGDDRKDAFAWAADAVSDGAWLRYRAWSKWVFEVHGVRQYEAKWYEMRWEWALEDPEWFEEICLAVLKGDL